MTRDTIGSGQVSRTVPLKLVLNAEDCASHGLDALLDLREPREQLLPHLG